MFFVFGPGFSASVVAARWMARGGRVAATTRTASEASSAGIERVHFAVEASREPLTRCIGEATHILVSIPPDDADADASPDPVLRLCADAIASSRRLAWLGYLSTTGVYGDRAGGWVDETSERRPGNARSRRRAAAEDGWLALWRDRGVPVHIFRLSGIYGPGRSALDQIRAGTAKRIDKPGQVFSRIHVDDIAAVVEASMARPRPGAIYNVADDLPAPASDVVAYAAELLGVAPPPLEPFDPPRLSPMAREFYAESRRVRNERIKRELGVVLRYPDYRAGLAAMVQARKPTSSAAG